MGYSEIFAKHWFFTLEENFARQKFVIATNQPIHFYSCVSTHAWVHYTFTRWKLLTKFIPHETVRFVVVAKAM